MNTEGSLCAKRRGLGRTHVLGWHRRLLLSSRQVYLWGLVSTVSNPFEGRLLQDVEEVWRYGAVSRFTQGLGE